MHDGLEYFSLPWFGTPVLRRSLVIACLFVGGRSIRDGFYFSLALPLFILVSLFYARHDFDTELKRQIVLL